MRIRFIKDVFIPVELLISDQEGEGFDVIEEEFLKFETREATIVGDSEQPGFVTLYFTDQDYLAYEVPVDAFECLDEYTIVT